MIQIGPVTPAHSSQERAVTRPGQLDLMLINPNSRARVYQSLGSDLAAIEPPVWIGLMATFIRDRGYSVKILDAEAEGIGPEEVAEHVRQLKPRLTAVIVYGQQPSASTQNMTAAGFEMVMQRQTFLDLSPVTKELLRLILEGRIRFGGNPVLRWNFDNVKVLVDNHGNVKPVKGKSTQKIDGVIALLCALACAIRRGNDGGKSIYESTSVM